MSYQGLHSSRRPHARWWTVPSLPLTPIRPWPLASRSARARAARPRSATCRWVSPTLEESIDAAIALGNNGADIIELGVPYSDPVMDGPVIQKATGQALQNGFKLSQLFEAVRRITEATDAVIVVMTCGTRCWPTA